MKTRMELGSVRLPVNVHPMRNPPDKNYILSAIGIISIGIISLGYIMFDRPFAEWNVQFSFLDFPVFIGEILFFACLCLCLLKGGFKVDKNNLWIIGYFAFVLIKAFWGYCKFGPLAFRDAAMFYYPAFIIFASSFYRRDFFDDKKIILFLVVVTFLFTRQGFNEYWILTCFILAFILIRVCSNIVLRYSLLGILLLVTPYKLFFSTSRMMMVANFIAGFYLTAVLYLVLRIKKEIKIALVVLSAFLIVWAFFSYADRNAVLGIVRGGKILETFKNYDAQIKEAKQKRAVIEKASPGGTIRVKIYNPDPPLSLNRLGKENLLAAKAVGAFSKEVNPPKREYLPNEYVGEALKENFKEEKVPVNNVHIYNPDPPVNFSRLGRKKEQVAEPGVAIVGDSKADVQVISAQRSLQGAYINAVFRILIWRDMLVELIKEKPILGFHFGKPLRSVSLETLGWGQTEWGRDGWIAAHNSYLHIIYRSGIIGLWAIWIIFTILFRMIKKSIQYWSLTGILLCAIIVDWFVAANFLLIFELPYTAIPVWVLFGLTYAYVGTLKPASSYAWNESQPFVTVLMTVYNGGVYLRPVIQSVLHQTYKNFELLIVDDASTDDSLKIIKSFEDPRIIIHSNRVNLGQTKSLNVGLKLARGRYIARMDADDLAFPRWLEELCIFLEQNPQVAVVSTKAAVINGRQIVRVLNTPLRWHQIVLKSLTFSPINHVGSMMRKEIVLKIGGYDERYHVPADFHLWSRLIRQGHRMAMVPKVLVAIRFHEKNQSKTKYQEEMITIIYDNVRHLTNYEIEEYEVVLLYRLTYDIASLNYREFKEAVTILENVYRHVKPSLGVGAFAEEILVEQQEIAAIKKIFASIEKSDLEQIRRLSRDYVSLNGRGNIFFLVWLISFGGGMILRLVPKIYDYLQSFRIQWMLRGEIIPKRIY